VPQSASVAMAGGRTTRTAIVNATAWSDYCCPWAYVGMDRTRHLMSLGVNVTTLGFELHPEWPPTGIAVQTNGRFGETLRLLAALAADVNMTLNVPARLPSTRLALATMELVRAEQPHRWWTAHEMLFAALWERGRDLGDRQTLIDELQSASIERADALVTSAEGGAAATALATAKEQGYDIGASGTPSWWLDQRLLVPGLQTREQMTQWVERLRARPASTT
jgi:predicted DsbA family dithiol-disulfide isomerase